MIIVHVISISGGKDSQATAKLARARFPRASAARWAMTSRGGLQFDLLASLEESEACSSSLGLCG